MIYLVIVTDTKGREYLVELHASRDMAESVAHGLRRKWTAVRVSAGVEGVALADLVSRWDSV